MNPRARIQKTMQMIDALTLRERLFVLGALLAVVGGAWEAFLAAPLSAREAIAQSKIETTRERLAQLDQSIEIAAQGIGGGMDGHYERLQTLRREVAEGEEALRIFATDLVDPAQMRLVLEDLLEGQRGLELVRAANLPVRPLLDADPDADDTSPEDAPMLYRHGLVLELEGGYLDCLAYLSQVERLPWKIFWHSLRIDADRHPRNRIVLELYTLSLEEDWIGV